jgi:lipid A ethanolaminephosphotransferase
VLLALVTVLNALLQLLAWPWIFKPLATLLLVVSAIATLVMFRYGVLFDRSLIRNAAETNVAELSELFTLSGLAYILILGLLPAALLLWVKVRYDSLASELRLRAALVGPSIVLVVAALWPCYRELSFAVRADHTLQLMVNPLSPIGSVVDFLRHAQRRAGAVEPIALDARRSVPERKRLVFVFVLGETARADHFSLNGYGRETNPELAARPVVDFPDVTACATATAEALPCLFSGRPRQEWSRHEASEHENLLDVLQRAGVTVLWKENNTGCKGVCERVPFEQVSGPPELFSDEEYFDEALLVGLQEYLDSHAGDQFIVLHQQGSHGPRYSKRSPPAFKRFLPECPGSDVQACERETVVNAYDNTILYTDHVLALTIDLLAANQATSQVAMLYVSDHGESLGENGIYLHGFPYWLAPREQTHVPMVFWASPDFYASRGASLEALRAASTLAYGHDNLFHTILGVFGVQTSAYDAALDLFEVPDRPQPAAGSPDADPSLPGDVSSRPMSATLR